jgi:hypothetical protein
VASGKSGDCAWRVTGAPGRRVLEISGEGAMDYYEDRYRVRTAIAREGVTAIGEAALVGSDHLVTVIIGKSVVAIGDKALDVDSLRDIRVDGDNPRYSSAGGALFDKGKGTLVRYPAGRGGGVVVPATVATIGAHAFFCCAGVDRVSLPAALAAIGEGAFMLCHGLRAVTVPAAVGAIGELAFAGSGLVSATLDCPVTGDYTFAGCVNLASVVINGPVTAIGRGLLEGCARLASVTLPGTVTGIGWGAFEDCAALAAVTLPAAVTGIEGRAFAGCRRLATVTVLAPVPPRAAADAFPAGGEGPLALRVPAGSVAAYRATAPWGDFDVAAT